MSFLDPAVSENFGGASPARQTGWPARDLFLATAQGRSLDATLYAKNVIDNIPAKVLKKIKEEIDAEG